VKQTNPLNLDAIDRPTTAAERDDFESRTRKMSYGGYDGGATQFAGGYMAECVAISFRSCFFAAPRASSRTGTRERSGGWMDGSVRCREFLKNFRIRQTGRDDRTIAVNVRDERPRRFDRERGE